MQFNKFQKLVLSAALGVFSTLTVLPAQADVVVVVSSKSSVDKLSGDQVGQLFLIKTVAFPNGGEAAPLDQSDTALHDEFYEKVTGKDPSQLKAYWSKLMFTGKGRPLKAVADNSEVKKQVASNPNAIGYISKSAVDSSVKVVFVP